MPQNRLGGLNGAARPMCMRDRPLLRALPVLYSFPLRFRPKIEVGFFGGDLYLLI
jgi:hypothetical protein